MMADKRAELVTEPIESFTEKGILTKDGKEREFDLVVLACGFKMHDYFHPTVYTGRDGATFAKAWEKDGVRSYLGVTMPEVPNFFSYYGSVPSMLPVSSVDYFS